MRQFSRFLLTFALTLLLASAAVAQSRANAGRDEDTSRTGLGRDIKAYVLSPLHWRRRDWLEFAGTVAAIGATYSADDRVREHFDGPAAVMTTKPDLHDSGDALPAFVIFAGTAIGAAVTRDRDGILEARSMIEAAAFATATSYLVKDAFGRARPYESLDRSDWRAGSDSFPSVHTTAAFAIGTVLAESGNDRYRWIRRIVGYGVAAGTAYRRLDHGAHWGSDTVAGAAIGIASARFMLARRDPGRRRGEAAVVPTDDGIVFRYAIALD